MDSKTSIWDGSFIYCIIAIAVGFLVGAILLVSAGIDPGLTYGTLISGIFSQPKYIVYSLVYAAPYIMTGLSVAFSFKTGVFNIGAEGQFVVGSLAAVLVGIFGSFPPVIHVILCFIAAAAAGAGWGAIVGLMKIKKGINEVLSYIMFNWIAYYLSNYVVMSSAVKADSIEATKDIKESASTVIGSLVAVTGCPTVNAGFIIATVAAILLYFIIQKTTFGYQLRAVGMSKTASEYGGISSSKIFMTSMAISGMLAGIGGAIQTLGMSGRIPQFSGQESFGFDGITVALIGSTNPIGCIFAGLFYGAMKYGGNKLSLVGAPKEIVNIIMGTIIFFIAISLLLKRLLKRAQQKKLDRTQTPAAVKEA